MKSYMDRYEQLQQERQQQRQRRASADFGVNSAGPNELGESELSNDGDVQRQLRYDDNAFDGDATWGEQEADSSLDLPPLSQFPGVAPGEAYGFEYPKEDFDNMEFVDAETFLANNRDPFEEAAEKDWVDGDQWEAEQSVPRASGSGIGGRPSFFFEQKSCNLDSVDFMSPQRQKESAEADTPSETVPPPRTFENVFTPQHSVQRSSRPDRFDSSIGFSETGTALSSGYDIHFDSERHACTPNTTKHLQEKNRFRSVRGASQQSKPIYENEVDHEKVALEARNAMKQPVVDVVDVPDSEHTFKAQVAVVEDGQGRVREALHEIDTIIQNSQDLSDKFPDSPRKLSTGRTPSADYGFAKTDSLHFGNGLIEDYDIPSQSGLPLSRTTDSWGEDPIGDDEFVSVNDKASYDGSPMSYSVAENRSQEQLKGNHEHMRMFSIQENGHVADDKNALNEVRARLAEIKMSNDESAEKRTGLQVKQSQPVKISTSTAADRIPSKEAKKATTNRNEYGFIHPYASGFEDTSEIPKELSIEEISHDLDDDDINDPEPTPKSTAKISALAKATLEAPSRFVTRVVRRDSDISNQDEDVVRHAPSIVDVKKPNLINQGKKPTNTTPKNKAIQFVSRKYLPDSDTSDEEGELGQWTKQNVEVKKIETPCPPLQKTVTPRSHSHRLDKLPSMTKDDGFQDSAVILSQMKRRCRRLLCSVGETMVEQIVFSNGSDSVGRICTSLLPLSTGCQQFSISPAVLELGPRTSSSFYVTFQAKYPGVVSGIFQFRAVGVDLLLAPYEVMMEASVRDKMKIESDGNAMKSFRTKNELACRQIEEVRSSDSLPDVEIAPMFVQFAFSKSKTGEQRIRSSKIRIVNNSADVLPFKVKCIHENIQVSPMVGVVQPASERFVSLLPLSQPHQSSRSSSASLPSSKWCGAITVEVAEKIVREVSVVIDPKVLKMLPPFHEVARLRHQISSQTDSYYYTKRKARRGLYFHARAVECGICTVGESHQVPVYICNGSDVPMTVFLQDLLEPFACSYRTTTIQPRKFIEVPVSFTPKVVGKVSTSLCAYSVTEKAVVTLVARGI